MQDTNTDAPATIGPAFQTARLTWTFMRTQVGLVRAASRRGSLLAPCPVVTSVGCTVRYFVQAEGMWSSMAMGTPIVFVVLCVATRSPTIAMYVQPPHHH